MSSKEKIGAVPEKVEKQVKNICGDTDIDKKIVERTMVCLNEVLADLLFTADSSVSGNPMPMFKTYVSALYARDKAWIDPEVGNNIIGLMKDWHTAMGDLPKTVDGNYLMLNEVQAAFPAEDWESEENRDKRLRDKMLALLRSTYKTIGQDGKRILERVGTDYTPLLDTPAFEAWVKATGKRDFKRATTALANTLACARMQIESSTDEPGSKRKKKSRLAVIGVESAGKSFFLNRIVNPKIKPDENGKLPSTEGMGTQVCCLLAQKSKDAVNRTIRYDGDPQEVFSDKEINDFIALKSGQIAELKRMPGGLDQGLDTRLIIVKDELFGSEADVTQEFLDVPGLKEETRMQTILALSTATSVAICTTNAKALAADFKGKLKILKDIINDVCVLTKQTRLPITIVFSRDIPESQGGSILDVSKLDEEKEAVKKAMEDAGLGDHYNTCFFGNFSRLSEINETSESFARKFMESTAKDATESKAPYLVYQSIADQMQAWANCIQKSVEEKIDAEGKKKKKGRQSNVTSLEDILEDLGGEGAAKSQFKGKLDNQVERLQRLTDERVEHTPPDELDIAALRDLTQKIAEVDVFDAFAVELLNRVRFESIRAFNNSKKDLFKTCWGAFEEFSNDMPGSTNGGEQEFTMIQEIVDCLIHSTTCSRETIPIDEFEGLNEELWEHSVFKPEKKRKNNKKVLEDQDVRKWCGSVCEDMLDMCTSDKVMFLFAGRNMLANDEVVKFSIGATRQFKDSVSNWFAHDKKLCERLKSLTDERKKEIESHNPAGSDIAIKVIECALGSAKTIFEAIEESGMLTDDVYSNEAAGRLVTMAREVFLRMFIEVRVVGDGEVGWTDFARNECHKMFEKPTEGLIRELEKPKNKIKDYKSSFAKIKARQEAESMTTDDSLVKKERMVAQYLEADELGADAPIRIQVVAINGMWNDEDVSELCKKALSTYNVEVRCVSRDKHGGKKEEDDQWEEIKQYKPQILVILRNAITTTTDLGSDEKTFIQGLSKFISTAFIVLVNPSEMKQQPNWKNELEDGLGNAKLVNINIDLDEEDGPHGNKLRLRDSNTRIQLFVDEMNMVCQEVRPILEKNRDKAMVRVQDYAMEFKKSLLENRDEESEIAANKTPIEFKHHMGRQPDGKDKSNRRKKNVGVDICARFPTKEVLAENFYTCTASVDKKTQQLEKTLDESRLNHFLRTLVVCQLVSNLKKFGGMLYDKYVESYKQKACGFFTNEDGDPDPEGAQKIDSLIEHFMKTVKNEEEKEKAKKKGKEKDEDEATFTGSGRFFTSAYEILNRENFIVMYCGCCLQSVAPFVHGVLGAKILGGTGINLVFKDLLECAEESLALYQARMGEEATLKTPKPKSNMAKLLELMSNSAVKDLKKDKADLEAELCRLNNQINDRYITKLQLEQAPLEVDD